MMAYETLADKRKKLALEIKEARTAKGMTQKLLASNCGIREQTLIDLEKGGNFEINTALSILSHLGLSLIVCGERF